MSSDSGSPRSREFKSRSISDQVRLTSSAMSLWSMSNFDAMKRSKFFVFSNWVRSMPLLF